MSSLPLQGPRNGILSAKIKDKAELYAVYMPFIKGGGIFVPTSKTYQMGDEVFLLLSLIDEPDKLPIAGKVIWITPRGAQGNRPPGIGLQFASENPMIQSKLENYLVGTDKWERPTYTL